MERVRSHSRPTWRLPEGCVMSRCGIAFRTNTAGVAPIGAVARSSKITTRALISIRLNSIRSQATVILRMHGSSTSWSHRRPLKKYLGVPWCRVLKYPLHIAKCSIPSVLFSREDFKGPFHEKEITHRCTDNLSLQLRLAG